MTVIDLRERQFVSQYAADVLGLSIFSAGAPADVDTTVQVTMTHELDAAVVFSRVAARSAVGMYQTSLSAAESSVPGLYTIDWSYALAGVVQEYRTYIEVGAANAAYDMLVPAMKDVVDVTWMRFADLFDSPGHGPNLMTYFQSHWSRGRLAELLRIAVGLLNTTAQPFSTYTLDGQGGASFPTVQWGALLERCLYVESVKHLIRSYTEQPMFVGGSVTRLDRRDYTDRWQAVLATEEPTLRLQLEIFKISHMGLGKPAVLVSGGVYGHYGPTRLAGSMAARPRQWTRWY